MFFKCCLRADVIAKYQIARSLHLHIILFNLHNNYIVFTVKETETLNRERMTSAKSHG